MKKIEWEYPACNLCGKTGYRVFRDKVTTWEHAGVFRVVECISCGLIYLHPRPKRKLIAKYYPKKTYWGAGRKGNWRKWRDTNFKPLYKFIFKSKKTGKVLDIGAGTGLFLTRFKEEGWVVEGVELSETASLLAKKRYKIGLKTEDFLGCNFPKNYFDVVSLINTLEHLYRPKETLRKIDEVLKEDGILVIVVPNIESLGAKIFVKNWHPLQPPRHLYHFSPSTLRRMLNGTGFQIKKISHSYWVHNYYSLFESFRFLSSPRFKKLPSGGLKKKTRKGMPRKNGFSAIKEIGKIFAHIFAFTFSLLGTIILRGEVITVYAQKA